MELTAQNYHSQEADKAFMSCHQFAAWLKCPAAEKARQDGLYTPEKPRAFFIGHYVDCALTTPALFPEFCDTHITEIMQRSGKNKLADVILADSMIQRVKNSPDAMRLLDGEGQAVVTGMMPYRDRNNEEKSVPWKIMCDVLLPGKGVVTDLKTVSSFEEDWKRVKIAGELQNRKVAWWRVYDYQIQMAVYRLILAQKYGKDFMPILLAVTKQDPPDFKGIAFATKRPDGTPTTAPWDEVPAWLQSTPAGYEPRTVDGARIDGMELVMMMKSGEIAPTRCGSCGYCRGTNQFKIEFANLD